MILRSFVSIYSTGVQTIDVEFCQGGICKARCCWNAVSITF